MRIFITGAEGFIGKELVSQCEKNGIEFIAVDKESTEKPNHYSADISSKNIADLIQENTDAIVHLAALSKDPDCKGKAYECFNLNVMGTLNLIEAAQKKKAKQFIFASTEWVYDSFAEGEVKTEESIINTSNLNSEYALSKIVTESNLRQRFSQGFCDVAVLRFGIIYGTRKGGSAVESLFNSVIEKDKVEVGSLKTGRCFIHVSDIASAIIKSVGLQGFNIINIQGNKFISLNEIIETSKKILNKSPVVIETDMKNPSIKRVSNEKAKLLLKWEPKISLEEGLQKLNSFLKNKELCSCIICGSENYENIYSYDSPDNYEVAVGVDKENYSRKWVKCKKCGFYYSIYSREKEVLNRIYSSLYRNSDSSWRKEPVKEVFNRIINLSESESETKQRVRWIKERINRLTENNILKNKSPPFNFLDIGGGNGIFAYEFKDNLWIPNVVDPDENSSFIKSEFGINFVNDYYSSGKFNFKFDMVSLIYVLEHLAEPVKFLKEVYSDMKEDSLFYVEVPDAISFNLKDKSDEIFNSTHLWMFTPSTLISFLERNGFEILFLDRVLTKRGHYAIMSLAIKKT